AEMPIDSAPAWLPRSASNVRPNVPLRNWTTASATSANTITVITRNVRSSLKSHGPSTGRGSRVPVSNELPPPQTKGSCTITASKKNANASVAIAVHTPASRRIGNDTSAATAAAISAPMIAPRSTDVSYRSTSWKTVNAPMAANAPWQREICPAMPVITVIDKKMIPSATACVTRNSHDASAWVNTTEPSSTRTTTCTARAIRARRGSGAAAPSVLGGGSTPANGSLAWCERRMPGTNTRTANSTTNGMAGVRLSWMAFNHLKSPVQRGRNVLTSAISTPRPIPPANAIGRLTRRPTAAAAIATTTMLKKVGAASVLNRGAINTPASPANNDDNVHA